MTKSGKINDIFLCYGYAKISRWSGSKRVIWCFSWWNSLPLNPVMSLGAGSSSCLQEWRSCLWPAVRTWWTLRKVHTCEQARLTEQTMINFATEWSSLQYKQMGQSPVSSFWASFFIRSPLGRIRDPAEKLRSGRNDSDMKKGAYSVCWIKAFMYSAFLHKDLRRGWLTRCQWV